MRFDSLPGIRKKDEVGDDKLHQNGFRAASRKRSRLAQAMSTERRKTDPLPSSASFAAGNAPASTDRSLPLRTAMPATDRLRSTERRFRKHRSILHRFRNGDRRRMEGFNYEEAGLLSGSSSRPKEAGISRESSHASSNSASIPPNISRSRGNASGVTEEAWLHQRAQGMEDSDIDRSYRNHGDQSSPTGRSSSLRSTNGKKTTR